MNKSKRIIGILLIISGICGIFSGSVSGILFGICLFAGGIYLVVKHPKANDAVSAPRPARKNIDAYPAALNNVPLYPIAFGGEYVRPLLVKDLRAFPHANITKTTPSDRYFRFISVDIETTGLNATSDIIEVSAIKWIGGEPAEVFTTLCKSDSPIPADASKINHITDDMIANAPYFYNILPSLQDFISDFPLVGHNIDFDLKFLQRYGLDVSDRLIFDTLDLAHKSIKKDNGGNYSDYRVENYKLETICRFFGINLPRFHRSLYDAYATGLIFLCLIARIVNK